MFFNEIFERRNEQVASLVDGCVEEAFFAGLAIDKFLVLVEEHDTVQYHGEDAEGFGHAQSGTADFVGQRQVGRLDQALDAASEQVGEYQCSDKGDEENMSISPREIINLLVLHNGYYFYLIHNHPNNSLSPSVSDITFTEKINKRAEKIGVKLLDHLIIGQTGYYSFLHSKVFS